MALNLILKNCTKSKGLSRLLIRGNEISFNSSKTYSGLVTSTWRNPGLNTNKISCGRVIERCMSSDHSKVWTLEKLVTLGLIGVGPVTFIEPSLIFDDILSVLLVVHMHWGLENAVVDYVRPIILGPTIPKITMGLLYMISFATLGGLLFFNHECIGIGCAVRKLWQITK